MGRGSVGEEGIGRSLWGISEDKRQKSHRHWFHCKIGITSTDCDVFITCMGPG